MSRSPLVSPKCVSDKTFRAGQACDNKAMVASNEDIHIHLQQRQRMADHKIRAVKPCDMS